MMDIMGVVSAILLLVGSVFALIGSIGIVRMPDVFTRLHAAGITDTLGAAGVLLGLALKAGFSLLLVKLLLMLAFLLLLNPTACHALARAALHGLRRPWMGLTHDD
ncbi:MAG: monovalent cation/H(+) antiporter subunit G [Gammaproteobacteria bacterium]|nr:monovalent cation/H(+) antiporter subunit G [Gammaproteobacteria bacterium]|tara:strand:- start:331 stop:648 length:318 start_codon:yes stop_codon:yes gene_type:complete